MAFNLEIEKKFICFPKIVPYHEAVVVNQIKQFYLAVTDLAEVRVGIKNNKKCEITIKSKSDFTFRDEYSYLISLEEANNLEKLKTGKTVLKKRYFIPVKSEESLFLCGKCFWEVDVYAEPIHDLVVAELEFTQEQADYVKSLTLPSWIDKDVTELLEFKNANIATCND